MNKKTIFSLVLLILVAVIWRYSKIRDIEYGDNSSEPQAMTEAFYRDWITGRYGLGNKSYQDIPIWTPKLVAKVDAIVASFDQGGYDPVLCAQDLPESFTTTVDEKTASTAKITVAERFGPETALVKVSLVKTNDGWKIDNLSCGNGVEGDPQIQTRVGDYLRENISALSPAKEVLGGKYYITKVTFTGDNSGEVEYEDGHIAHRASFDFEVSNGSVQIKNFKILE